MAPDLEHRAHSARKTLNERYDKLSALWKAAEKKLSKLPIPRDVAFCYESEEHPEDGGPLFDYHFGLHKRGGEYRLVHGTYFHRGHPDSAIEWILLSDCPIDLRREMVQHFAKLEEEVVLAAEEYVPRVDQAIEQLDQLVNGSNLPELLAERARLNGQAK